jgi:hypothetical protein
MSEYNIVDISTIFNKNIKQLLVSIDNSIHNNVIFDTIKRQVRISIDANPLLLLQEGGPYIFDFRDYIKDDKFDELFLDTENVLQDKYKNGITQYANEIGNEKSNNILQLLLILRDVWKNYSNIEKKNIKKNIKVLLSEYCKFLSISKH